MRFRLPPPFVLVTAGILSVSCTPEDEAHAVAQFRELRSSLSTQALLMFEAARNGDSVTLESVVKDTALRQIRYLAETGASFIDGVLDAGMDDLDLTAGYGAAELSFRFEGLLFVVFFEHVEGRWTATRLSGPH